jgi:Fe-S cluster biogenesis protein NfuA
MDEIKITGEPSTNGDRCAFLVDRPILPAESAHFEVGAGGGDSAAARHSPLATELLAIPGIESVLVADNTVTVTAAHPVDWPALGIGHVIRRHMRSGTPIVAREYFESLPSEGDLKWAIRDLLDREINPAVGQHGGYVELIDVRKNNVYLRLGGGCQGCGAADVTLKQGIEKAIRNLAPSVGEILDTTDHAAGRNPYYAPAK